MKIEKKLKPGVIPKVTKKKNRDHMVFQIMPWITLKWDVEDALRV